MSVQRGNGQNGGHFYSNITFPVLISCNFIVDSTNGNGLGVRSIKSNGYIENVFMHTSATPGVGGNNLTNPNPASGLVMVQFKNNFNYYLGGFSGFVSPPTGSSLTSVTAGTAYTITTLGTTTAAQWLAAGVPAGVVPAVNGSFVAIETGAIGGTGTVHAVGVSGVASLEVIGDTNMGATSNIATYSGEWLIGQFLNGSAALTAPANNTVVGMSFLFDRSSVTLDGL
jgi:hypothetical protein